MFGEVACCSNEQFGTYVETAAASGGSHFSFAPSLPLRLCVNQFLVPVPAIWHRHFVPYAPPPDLATLSLAEIAELNAARKLPPVEQWDPQVRGDSLMVIRADGRWFHAGGEIRRPAMIRAFAGLLRRDDAGQHWLVTPAEQQSIAVEDAAFLATDVSRTGDALAFRLNTDEIVLAGPDNQLIARGTAELPAVYLQVRHGTEARINRSTWLQLVDLADTDLAVTSQAKRFSLVPQ